MPMDYREMQPAVPLQAFVRCFWQLRGEPSQAARAQRVLPDGCADLLIDCAAVAGGASGADAATRWVGTMTRPLDVIHNGYVDLFGVRFAPGGMYPFLRVPLDRITDATVTGVELWPRALDNPADALAECAGFEQRCEIVSARLLAALPHVPAEVMPGLLAWLEQLREIPNVRTLATRSGFSERTLQRRFLDWVGVTPKQHLRYLRFERARTLLERRGISGAEIACALLYSDQAHFIHEFRRFAGAAPGQWLRPGLTAATRKD